MRLIKFFQYEKGLTFIEILIVLLITSLIAITVIRVLRVSIGSNRFDVVTVEDLQQARRALRRITDEINYAHIDSAITINNEPSGNQRLNYNNNNGNPCTIFLNRGTIFFQQPPLAQVAITTQNIVQSLNFEFDAASADSRSINITITLRNGRIIKSTARKLNQRT